MIPDAEHEAILARASALLNGDTPPSPATVEVILELMTLASLQRRRAKTAEDKELSLIRVINTLRTTPPPDAPIFDSVRSIIDRSVPRNRDDNR